MSRIKQKIQLFRRVKSIFKNWIIFPFIYYDLIFSNFIFIKTNTDILIKIRNHSTDFMALLNVWVLEEYNSKNYNISNDGPIIDIGAHIGLFSLYVSQFYKNSKIFCYEPNKENFELLIENLSNNNLKNIFANNLAVSDSNEKIKLYINKDQSGHNLFYKSELSEIVQSITLQKIFDDNKITKCSILKLDCEGAEYQILKSLPQKYLKNISFIILEYHMADSNPELIEELQNYLKQQNFDTQKCIPKNGMGMFYAQNNSI